MLASMFHSLFAISCKLSPTEHSSGIEMLQTNSFKLHCFQTITGVKFFAMTDTRVNNMDGFLKRLYELYADYALKNPFYSLEMPIRCDLFDTNLQKLIEQSEKSIAHSLNTMWYCSLFFIPPQRPPQETTSDNVKIQHFLLISDTIHMTNYGI